MIRSIVGGFIGCLLANYFIEELAKEEPKIESTEEVKEEPKVKKPRKSTKKKVTEKE